MAACMIEQLSFFIHVLSAKVTFSNIHFVNAGLRGWIISNLNFVFTSFLVSFLRLLCHQDQCVSIYFSVLLEKWEQIVRIRTVSCDSFQAK